MALPQYTTRKIQAAVDKVFDRIKGRFLGPDFARDKSIIIGLKPDLSLPGIYRTAAAEELTRPNKAAMDGLLSIAESYIDAHRELTKAKILKTIGAWLTRQPDADVEGYLERELYGVWHKVRADVEKVVDTESTTARNLGSLEGITKVQAMAGVTDPHVYFVVVRDNELCEECRRVHLMPDEVTPRVFLLSEVGQGYHKRGSDSPSVGGLHPHCRCTIASLLPGYGFDGGRLRFVDVGYDLLAAQRGD